ncbi:MAG: zinc-dependent alcohol dehydrogenase family protein [Parachlamydiaceae bacterium]|nr:zinc-dependent alcohol dehydrogenase family protein [Parachlamydiaceae bacterium]
MHAMVLTKLKSPLEWMDLPKPIPGKGQLLIKVHCCGLCRTDLHVIDGELTHPVLPIIPGHQIVGTVVEKGIETHTLLGRRVGVPWLGGTCGHCHYCLDGRENLCDAPLYTGYHTNGGFAEFCVANEAYCFSIPDHYPDIQAAPLLCAGLIGSRALRFTEQGRNLGLYGFGAAAHIVIQIARHQGRSVFVFTRPGDIETQNFAKSLGAIWAGSVDDLPPNKLDAAIIFAPSGDLIPKALKATSKGAIVVCAGIHMSDIPAFPYSLLWEERTLRSVANLTRRDGEEFLELAPRIPVETSVTTYSLRKVNAALDDLRHGRFHGAAVITA